jgi:putative RecB family exonuclease
MKEDVESDRQLALYQMGVAEKWQGIQEVRLIWHYLTFDTEIHSSRTHDQLDQLRQATLKLIQTIESDRRFLPKEGPLCDWCDYQAHCPKRKHLITVGSLPANEYLNEEGVVLVNQYAEMKERKRILSEEIDAELAKLEEALYAYAQREELETIFGSDHVAKIKIEMKEKFPLKGDPSRRILDEMIKKAGKWMEVSDLNPWMLTRVIDRRGWPSSLLNKIKEFSTVEESRSITVSKLKERD